MPAQNPRPYESDERSEYNPWRRQIDRWQPGQLNIVSRHQLEQYLNCACCYWYYKRGYIRKQPSKGGPNMNLKVHKLYEKEFLDAASRGKIHPLFSRNGLYIGPFQHVKMEEWREPLKGGFRIRLADDLVVTGAPDLLFQNLYDTRELHIGEIKTMSRSSEERIEIHPSTPRQMAIYKWEGGRVPELRELGHYFSNTGFLIIANFPDHDGYLGDAWPVEKHLYTVELDDSWVEQAFLELHESVLNDTPPQMQWDCSGCVSRAAYLAVDVGRNTGMSPEQVLEQFRDQMLKMVEQQRRMKGEE